MCNYDFKHFFLNCFGKSNNNFSLNTEYTINELYNLTIEEYHLNLLSAESTIKKHFREFLEENVYISINKEKRPYKVAIHSLEFIPYIVNTIEIKKEKSKIYFDKNLYFDFNTRAFNQENFDFDKNQNSKEQMLLQYIYFNKENCKEWVFNYIELLPTDYRIISHINFDCPKGYIKYLKDNCLAISNETYEDFLAQDYIKKHKVIGYLYNTKGMRLHTIQSLCEHMSIEALEKMIHNSYKNYDFENLCYLNQFVTLVLSHKDFNGYDTNRDIQHNKILLNAFIENKKNKILSNNLQKLNFINGFKINNYVVVVPQNIVHLQEEGRQQNNCVGYYYNNSIIKNQNFIYFIRKADNADKSFVTCRYNVSNNRTVEARLKFNRNINTDMWAIITDIDIIIDKLLKVD